MIIFLDWRWKRDKPTTYVCIKVTTHHHSTCQTEIFPKRKDIDVLIRPQSNHDNRFALSVAPLSSLSQILTSRRHKMHIFGFFRPYHPMPDLNRAPKNRDMSPKPVYFNLKIWVLVGFEKLPQRSSLICLIFFLRQMTLYLEYFVTYSNQYKYAPLTMDMVSFNQTQERMLCRNNSSYAPIPNS